MPLPAVTRIILSVLVNLFTSVLAAQSVQVREEIQTIKTYPFSDPNPVPVLTTNAAIYPYHTFEGYSTEAQEQEWKVVTLENEYIQVSILPEVGGKVWGAIDKSSGEEFIYKNEVLKFRNIAMRGPWTSGGIEFNYGIIGHSPATASPVNYVVEEHDDGSVSCTVGTIDLPSRTQWRVRITLAPDQAYFTTQSLWYNPTPTQQAYYNWMTAAAEARSDLEFFYPGHLSLEHSGEAVPWPIDGAGRELNWYRNNNFGSSKSYHIVGKDHTFFGGYWHDTETGFGHWAHHHEMLGQKLWIWALSRRGGIWEDLLTDTDGQYIEYQAGRLFNQYSPGAPVNPISKVSFAPHTSDRWREVWFPYNKIGGLTNVSPTAAMNISIQDGPIKIGLNALRSAEDTLTVRWGDQILFRENVSLAPAEVYEVPVELPQSSSGDLSDVTVTWSDLHYRSQDENKTLQRPFAGEALPLSVADSLYRAGVASYRVRQYVRAAEQLTACLEQYPAHYRARVALAELRYRQGSYELALELLRPCLIADTYDYDANYIIGLVYRAQGELTDALESLGLASRTPAYRVASYSEMAEIALQQGDYLRAEDYARQAYSYDQHSISALQVLAVALRLQEKTKEAQETLSTLLAIDPLNHFAYYERYLLNPTDEQLRAFQAMIRSEMPYQTYLELAIAYQRTGQTATAKRVLEVGPDHPLAHLWLAYLTREQAKESQTYLTAALAASPELVFPFRLETQTVLDWAQSQQDHWKLRYYRGLTHWAVGQPQPAVSLFQEVGASSDYAPFYLARAELIRQTEGDDGVDDIQRALSLDDRQWRSWHQLLDYYNRQGLTNEADTTAEQAYRRFPDSYVIGMDYAQALLARKKYSAAAQLLDSLEVLPYEGASEGRTVFEQVYLRWATQQLRQQQYDSAILLLQTSLDWPENLGVGKPYDPETRPQDYLLSYAYQQLGKSDSAQRYQQRIINATRQLTGESPYDALAVLSLREQQQTEPAERLLEQMLRSPQAAVRQAANYLDSKEIATLSDDGALELIQQLGALADKSQHP